ncbi:hypothetical protein [Streptomyces sp. NPDC055400]
MIQVPDFGGGFWVYQVVDQCTEAFAQLSAGRSRPSILAIGRSLILLVRAAPTVVGSAGGAGCLYVWGSDDLPRYERMTEPFGAQL